MNIQGKLVIIGGAVDKGSFTETNLDDNSSNNLNFFEEGILKRIIDESKHKTQSRIEVITTASKIPKEIGPEYVKALNYLGANNVDILNIERREEAMDPVIVARLKAADVVMFTGGDQLRLTSILGGTLFHDLLLEKYHKEDFIYAGTSAGAAAASNNMIYQGSSSEALFKGEVKITSGLGLIDGVIIDTHFVQRGRIGRLFQSVVGNPKVFGIGLGEDTGLLITNGKQMEAIGSGLVILVDGREIKDTNLTEIELGQPISISHLVTHVMSKFDTFNLGTFKMTIQSSQYV
ncbi:cyanophycinase [Flavobacterium psychrophilum]|uniref:Cyanophycinase n=1 Tax=Flavobacterium psychrophilum TaxID=96345 RepID=A0A7U2RAP0_FLAPS|nr:cyanophycinase [Flavobacterium psychrophilum]QRE03662.1 cyanophycinase [Flavobacterium psychrophilum]